MLCLLEHSGMPFFSRHTHTALGPGMMPLLPQLCLLVYMGGSLACLLSTLLVLPQRVKNDSPHLPGPCPVSLTPLVDQVFLAYW